MDGIDFVGYLVDGFLERTDVCGRGRDSKENRGASLKKADGEAILWQDLKERPNGKVRVLCA